MMEDATPQQPSILPFAFSASTPFSPILDTPGPGPAMFGGISGGASGSGGRRRPLSPFAGETANAPPTISPENLTERPHFMRYGKRRSPLAQQLASRGLAADSSPLPLPAGVGPTQPVTSSLAMSVFGQIDRKEQEPTRADEQRAAAAAAASLSGPENQDVADEAYERFATILTATLQGNMRMEESLLQYEVCCRTLSSGLRDNMDERALSSAEQHVLQAKSQALHSEAATWSLLYHLYGYATPQLPEDCMLRPSPSEQDMCEFVCSDLQAQVCCRVLRWLEGLQAHQLDLHWQRTGTYIGTYPEKAGLWQHTRRGIRDGAVRQQRQKWQQGGSSSPQLLVRHADPDATTREGGCLHPEDERAEESLLEDVWRLITAGRGEEALQLCRAAGQAWRAATLTGGGLASFRLSECLEVWNNPDLSAPPSAVGDKRVGMSSSSSKGVKRGKEALQQQRRRQRAAQAAELLLGRGRARRLWKWAAFCSSEAARSKYEAAVFASICGNISRMLPACPSWETACWAVVRGWLDFQVDAHLAHLQGLLLLPLDRDAASSAAAAAAAVAAEGVAIDPGEDPTAAVERTERVVSAAMSVHGSGRRGGGGGGGGASWPQPVATQQPQAFRDVFQMLRSSSSLPTRVRQASSEPHHQLQEQLIASDFGRVILLLRQWVVPYLAGNPHALHAGRGGQLGSMGNDDDEGSGMAAFGKSAQPADPSSLLRCGAHLVIFLRSILPASVQLANYDWLRTSGDVILYAYCVQLLSTRRDWLVAVYAADLRPSSCEEFYAQLMNQRKFDSSAWKQRTVESMLQHLPLDGVTEGSLRTILARVLNSARSEVGQQYAAQQDWCAAAGSDARASVAICEWAAVVAALSPAAGLASAVAAASDAAAAVGVLDAADSGGNGSLSEHVDLRGSFALSLRHGNAVLRELALECMSIAHAAHGRATIPQPSGPSGGDGPSDRDQKGSSGMWKLLQLLQQQGQLLAQLLSPSADACTLLGVAGEAALVEAVEEEEARRDEMVGVEGGEEDAGEKGKKRGDWGSEEDRRMLATWYGSETGHKEYETMSDNSIERQFWEDFFSTMALCREWSESAHRLESLRGSPSSSSAAAAPAGAAVYGGDAAQRQREEEHAARTSVRACETAYRSCNAFALRYGAPPFSHCASDLDAPISLEASRVDPEQQQEQEQEQRRPQHLVSACVALVTPPPYSSPVGGDPAVCASLAGALLASLDASVAEEWQAVADVVVHPEDERLLMLTLRCVPPLSAAERAKNTSPAVAMLASAVKGELPYLEAGVLLQLVRVDAVRWVPSAAAGSSDEGGGGLPEAAPDLMRDLCWSCCMPYIALQSLKMRLHAATLLSAYPSLCSALRRREEEEQAGVGLVAPDDASADIVALISDALHPLFSHRQLQEVLLLEREGILRAMEDEQRDRVLFASPSRG